MNTKYYSLSFIALHALIVGALVLGYITSNEKQDGDGVVDFAQVAGCIIVGAIVALLAYMTKFIYYLLVLEQSHQKLLQYQSTYESFYQPILEELIKFVAILWFQQAKYDRYLNPFELLLVWCGFTIPSLTIYFYNPRGYTQKYSKFLSYYHTWMNQSTGEGSNFAEENHRASKVWTTLVRDNIDSGMNDKERRRSTISSNKSYASSHKLKAKLSSKILPTEFNLNKDTISIHETASSPVINISSSLQDSFTCDESCSKAVQRLYSVSPRDTYHLITAVAAATFGDDDGEEGEGLESVDATVNGKRVVDTSGSQELIPEMEEVFDNIDNSFEEDQNLSDGDCSRQGDLRPDMATTNMIPYDMKMHNRDERALSTQCPELSLDFSNRSESLKSKGLSFINWWSWLCPPLLPICKGSQNKEPATLYQATSYPKNFANERFPLLKAKLSNYSLNERRVEERRFDRDMSNLRSTARVHNFQLFLSYYFDISLSPIVHPFAIDRWFVKYGQLLTDASFVWVFLDELNLAIWQLFVFQVIGSYLRDPGSKRLLRLLPIVVVIKLFKMNYLRRNRKCFDFRFIITFESIACTLLLCSVLLFINRVV
ncbi:hypothetical protein I9W82_000418 [Candida metapsilosis]|uniref:Uncharacterized protein n=1 Tax=Candida metapsilosis TaxID=273372 RepID=A0A8H8DCA3_9ASCO|nr:hypothetical protein I9W82_000418 [Candida metapsilosis]